MLHKLFFEFQYRFSKPPWDSGITPPEVVAFVENDQNRGHALDLGCGTGTNSIYLAQHGFSVVGVDFARKAIATARAKAHHAGVTVDFHAADVTRLDFLHDPFDLILDIGCFHALDEAGRTRYAQHLVRLTRPGSTFMLYAFSPRPETERGHLLPFENIGVTPEQVQQAFVPYFAVDHIEQGADRGERVSTWYWFKRR